MRSFIRLTFALFLMGFGHSAYAVDYYWYHSFPGTKYSSPDAACAGWLGESTKLRRYSLTKTSESTYFCQLQRISDGALVGFGKDMNRDGDGCTLPAVYNPDNGSCEAPEPDECESKNGDSTPFTKSGTAPDSYAVVLPGGTLGQEQSACFSGCVVSTSEQLCKGGREN